MDIHLDDTLSVLSKDGLLTYTSSSTIIDNFVWDSASPAPFHDVIVLLSFLSLNFPYHCTRCQNCSHYATVASIAIQFYRSKMSPRLRPDHNITFKPSRLPAARIWDQEKIFMDAMRVIVKFFEWHVGIISGVQGPSQNLRGV